MNAQEISKAQVALRTEGLAARKRLPPDYRRQASLQAAAYAKHLLTPDRPVVAAFAAVRDEINTLPLFEALWEAGVTLCLPVVVQRDQPLVFRVYLQGEELVRSHFAIGVPPARNPLVTPDLVFVPLSAFDRHGGRVGYGGGYYDRTLADLRTRTSTLAIGYGFAAQEVELIPLADHDERLDIIVTEGEIIPTSS